jgi:hypothetical protein
MLYIELQQLQQLIKRCRGISGSGEGVAMLVRVRVRVRGW